MSLKAKYGLTTLAVSCVSLMVMASNASAQEMDQVFKDWTVYTIKQQGKKTCYIASTPKKEAGTYSKRGEPYVLMTHIRNDVDEYSTSSGYPYKNGSEVTVNIDGDKYMLFTKGDIAWAYDSKQDNAMVKAMKKGAKMVVKGISHKSTTSDDTYSLSGFTKAYERMKSLCKK